ERNQFGRKSGEPLELPLGRSEFDQEVAALDVAEVTQSLTEGLCHLGISGRVVRQQAYPNDLRRLLGLGSEQAEEPTEGEDDAKGESQSYHLGSGPSNLFPRRVRIGPTSPWCRPRSLTPPLTCGAPRQPPGVPAPRARRQVQRVVRRRPAERHHWSVERA